MPGKGRPFVKGQSGNPKGRPRGREITDALRAELTDKDRQQLARKIIGLALAGNIPAIAFLADRLEGKPVQALEHSGPEGERLLLLDVPKLTGVSNGNSDSA
jgi:hypothetical protein